MRSDSAHLWAAVDELVMRAPGIAALRHHRLQLLAAKQLRTQGLEVDPQLREVERITAMRLLAAPRLLELIRASVDGPLVLMKGPEAGASYASPECRPFGDLDVLTTDAEGAFAALLRAGFQEIGKCDAGHHAPPLVWPGVPLTIELHSTVKWIGGLSAPPNHELLTLTRPSATGVAGFEGFIPAAHAVLLAVHAWAHGPLQCVGQLIDIASVLTEADHGRADELAERWGCARVWRTTLAAIDVLLGQPAPSMPARTWARHLLSSREPRVVERAVARIVAPVWALPRRVAPAAVGAELLNVARRQEWETRDEQLLRSRQALRHPFRAVSEFRT